MTVGMCHQRYMTVGVCHQSDVTAGMCHDCDMPVVGVCYQRDVTVVGMCHQRDVTVVGVCHQRDVTVVGVCHSPGTVDHQSAGRAGSLAETPNCKHMKTMCAHVTTILQHHQRMVTLLTDCEGNL